MNYKETLNYIHSLGNFSKPPTLDRINKVLGILGNPQNNFKSIHIAGTNGKGSVSAMLHSVFKTAGYRTGLFVSPYIIDFCERIQICGEFIPKEELTKLALKVIETKVELTEFEFITAVAFLYFSEQKCDVVIVETGLGGRLDATNSLVNKIANVITKIGLDHTAVLGDTIEQITREKCGIIKNSPLITSFNQPKAASGILAEYNPIIPNKDLLEVVKSDISGNSFVYNGVKYETALAGIHQIENALIVIETALTCGIDIPNIQKGIKEAFFPARMEVVSEKPLVILDGAHNPDGAEVLSRVMQQQDGEITAIIGMMHDKDCDSVLAKTLPYCKKALVVTVENMPRSLSCKELEVLASKYCHTEICDSYQQALSKLRDSDVVFVFGSLYLASTIRERLKNFFKI